MTMPRHHLLILLLGAGALLARADAADKTAIEGGSAEEKAAGLAWSFAPDPALPDVLILGDSISIGYTLLVRSRLAGVANVFRPLAPTGKGPANCADTAPRPGGPRRLAGRPPLARDPFQFRVARPQVPR